jgi:hypothetical protein
MALLSRYQACSLWMLRMVSSLMGYVLNRHVPFQDGITSGMHALSSVPHWCLISFFFFSFFLFLLFSFSVSSYFCRVDKSNTREVILVDLYLAAGSKQWDFLW